MKIALNALEKELMQLSEGQKVTLAHRMLVSTEPAADPEIDAAWEAEIARRIDKLDSGQTERHSASEVFGELDRRLPA